jgi:hypothetical protein
MTLTEIKKNGSTKQRKALAGLRSSLKAFHSSLNKLDWAKSKKEANMSYYEGLVRTAQNFFDEAKINFQKELGLNNFETQEIINRFK